MPLSRKRVIFYSLFTIILAVFSIFSLAYYQLRNLGEVKTLAVEKLEELTRRKVKIGDYAGLKQVIGREDPLFKWPISHATYDEISEAKGENVFF